MGTNIFVGAVSKERFSKGKDIKAGQESAWIRINYLYDGDKTLTGYYTKAKKGDKQGRVKKQYKTRSGLL